MMGPIFISYSRKDNEVMWRIVRFLQGLGIKVWLDNEKLIPGTPIWEEEIEKAIKAAPATIVVMSPDSKNSEWVRREISLADQNRKQIFPVLVRGDEDSSITLRLITRQYVDIRDDEKAGLNSLYAALSNFLNSLEAPETENPSLERNTQADSVSPRLSNEKQPVSSVAIWIPLAWALAGALGGFLYSEYGTVIGGIIGGAIGGLITANTTRTRILSNNPKNIIWIALAWGFAAAVGWTIGEELTEAIGMGTGYAIFAAVALTITFRLQHNSFDWIRITWIILTWAIGGMIGWSIGRYNQDNGILDLATGWALGYALSWSIAGFITIRQLRDMKA
jgi:hypothetical protein